MSETLGPRESGVFISENSNHVFIHEEAIPKMVQDLYQALEKDDLRKYSITEHETFPSKHLNQKQALNYVLFCTTQYFCYWHLPGKPRWSVIFRGVEYRGTFALYAAVAKAYEKGIHIFDPTVYSKFTVSELDKMLKGKRNVSAPLIKERLKCAQEVGTVLLEKFNADLLHENEFDIAIYTFFDAESNGDTLRPVTTVPYLGKPGWTMFHRRASELKVGVSYQLVHQVLQNNGLYPYHLTPVQSLLPRDYVSRMRLLGSFENCILQAKGSAQALLKIVVENFPCFDDSCDYVGKRVSFHTRAQQLVVDTWGLYCGKGISEFNDIDSITMFADYRVPQSLVAYGILEYSDELMTILRRKEILKSGCEYEVEIRGCTIRAVDLAVQAIREFMKQGDRKYYSECNDISVDNYLWAYRKQQMKMQEIPHHRVISIHY